MKEPQQHFIINAPEPGDTRPRNAFGVLIGFGKAYNEYHERKDREMPYTITPARYAKGMMCVRPNDEINHSEYMTFKGRASRLCDHLRGRWTHRDGGYIMSPTKAARFEKLYAEGWSAHSFSGELYKPATSTCGAA
jgi:hypothetical protein